MIRSLLSTQRVTIVLASLFIVSQASLAAPRVFRDHNFSIEFPSHWRVLNPPPPQTLVAAQSPDGLRTLVIVATKLPKSDIPAAAADMIAGAKQSAIDNGWRVTNEREASLSGVPFHALRTQVSASASTVTYISVTGNEGYILQGVCTACDADSDPELMAAVNSF